MSDQFLIRTVFLKRIPWKHPHFIIHTNRRPTQRRLEIVSVAVSRDQHARVIDGKEFYF